MEFRPHLLTPDLADLERAVSRAMWQAAKDSPLSRGQIVDRMNEMAAGHGRKLTGGSAKLLSEAVFEKWLNDTDPSRPSFYALGVFSRIVKSNGPIDAQAAPHGYRVITDFEAKILRMKQIEIQRAKLAKEERELKREMGL